MCAHNTDGNTASNSFSEVIIIISIYDVISKTPLYNFLETEAHALQTLGIEDHFISSMLSDRLFMLLNPEQYFALTYVQRKL